MIKARPERMLGAALGGGGRKTRRRKKPHETAVRRTAAKAKKTVELTWVTVRLPDDHPDAMRRAELEKKIADRRERLIDHIALPAELHSARWSEQYEDLVRSIAALEDELPPVEIAVPVEWWALPPGDPRRELSLQLIAHEPPELSEEEFEAAKIGADLATLASLTEDVSFVEQWRKRFAACGSNQERRELYDQFHRMHPGLALPRRITGPRPKYEKWEVPPDPANGEPGKTRVCGAPTKRRSNRDRVSPICRRQVLAEAGKPLTCDGLCFEHTKDPRISKTREDQLPRKRETMLRNRAAGEQKCKEGRERRRQRRLAAQYEAVHAAYRDYIESGDSIAKVAARHGFPKPTLWRLFDERGLKCFPPGRRPTLRRRSCLSAGREQCLASSLPRSALE